MGRRRILPNIVTLGNLFLGYLAILAIMQGKFTTACWLIVVAVIMDGLDGFVARLIKENSRFGAQIDSLADAVSFGVAPGILVYTAVLKPFGLYGLLLSFLPIAAGITRLARFNILQETPKTNRDFIGLPIPIAALIITSFFIYVETMHEGFTKTPVYLSLIPALSLLMLSPIPYRRPPFTNNKHGTQQLIGKIVMIVGGALVIWNPALTLFPLSILYLLSGPTELVIIQLRKLRRSSSPADGLSDDTYPDKPRRNIHHRRNN